MNNELMNVDCFKVTQYLTKERAGLIFAKRIYTVNVRFEIESETDARNYYHSIKADFEFMKEYSNIPDVVWMYTELVKWGIPRENISSAFEILSRTMKKIPNEYIKRLILKASPALIVINNKKVYCIYGKPISPNVIDFGLINNN